jgi:hypothetical protein
MTSVNNKNSSYLNPTDWAQLNANANLRVKTPNAYYWTSNDASAAPAVIEYLFKIW